MKSILVEIFNPNHIGIYPNCNIETEEFAYSIWKNIPFICYDTINYFNNYHIYKVRRKQFIASILLERLDWPLYCFSPYEILTINLLLPKFNLKSVYERLDILIRSKLQIKAFNYDDHLITKTHKEQKIYCGKNEYINYHFLKEKNFKKQIEILNDKYRFEDKEINIKNFNRRLGILSNSNNLLNIALHYFINASRLILNQFPEDAGINLNMVLEALVKDYMVLINTKNKKMGIDSFNNFLKLDSTFIEWLQELYLARNEFLAHIDEEMFTFNERINDPDSYCYLHYGSISWLIIKYFNKRKKLLNA